MTTTKHTPGPWKVASCCLIDQSPSGEWFHKPIVSMADDFANAPCICDVDPKAYRKTQREAMKPDPVALANARLIAAAPDLLAACRELVAFSFAAEESRGDYASALRDFCRLKRNIRAAIAEAEGRP